MKDNRIKFNIFSFISTFARSLIEIFVSLYLFKNGFSIKYILIFYLLENLFAIFLSYIFVKLGEKYKYSTVMYIGIISFIILQIVLNNVNNSISYLLIISLLYSMYRRGYWCSRRFYITNVIPQENSSEKFSIILILSQLSSILSGYIGAIFLDNFNMIYLTIISSILLFISVIPLTKIKYKTTNKKVELLKNIKKYDKRNYVAFSLYELNNLLTFLFPIYIAMYIQNSYIMASSVNAINNIAIMLFIFIYGKLIKKKNYFLLSSSLFVIMCAMKVFLYNYFILVIYFFEGMVKLMQNQSVNKIYFENRNNMDLTHYNLIYQLLECLIRVIVLIPLLFMNNIRVMIMFILIVISIELLIYNNMKKDNKLN